MVQRFSASPRIGTKLIAFTRTLPKVPDLSRAVRTVLFRPKVIFTENFLLDVSNSIMRPSIITFGLLMLTLSACGGSASKWTKSSGNSPSTSGSEANVRASAQSADADGSETSTEDSANTVSAQTHAATTEALAMTATGNPFDRTLIYGQPQAIETCKTASGASVGTSVDALAANPLNTMIGPIVLDNSTLPARSAVDFYLVSTGTGGAAIDLGPNNPSLKVSPDQDNFTLQRTLIRVMDTQERLLYWHFKETHTDGTTTEHDAGPATWTGAFCMPKAGVYRVQIYSTFNTQVRMAITSDIHYGIAFPYFAYAPWTGMPSTNIMYMAAPQHKSIPLVLKLNDLPSTSSAGLVSITDISDGNNQIQLRGKPIVLPSLPGAPPNPASGLSYSVPPSLSGGTRVWKLGLSPAWGFFADGFPVILCDLPKTALAIGGSVTRIATSGRYQGLLVSHRMQEEIAEIIPLLLQYIGNADDMINQMPTNYPATNPLCVNPVTANEASKSQRFLSYYDGTFTGTSWVLRRDTYPGNPGDPTAVPPVPPTPPDPGYGQLWQTVDSADEMKNSTGSRWVGAIGLPLKGAQSCLLDEDCVNGSKCRGPDASGNSWCAMPFSEANDYWDHFRNIHYYNESPRGYLPVGGGMSLQIGTLGSMAYAATTYHPCNYFGPIVAGGPMQPKGKQLYARAVIAALTDLLMVGADGYWQNPNTANYYGEYPGYAAFTLGQKVASAFGYAAPYLIDTFQDPLASGETLGGRTLRVWGEMIRMIVDRLYMNDLVSDRNQSAHNLVSFEYFYKGSQNLPYAAIYGTLSREYAARFFRSKSAAGYFKEDEGPDGNYTGITQWNIGSYYRLTQSDPIGTDRSAKAALAGSYDFFNQSVVKEPLGKSYVAGFNFNHRVGAGSDVEQYQGAREIAEDVPQVSLWVAEPSTPQQLALTYRTLTSYGNQFDANAAAMDTESLGEVSMIGRFRDPSLRVPAALPSESLAPWSKMIPAAKGDGSTINGEGFLAVNRPTYYAAVYVGHPAPSPYYIQDTNHSDWAILRHVPPSDLRLEGQAPASLDPNNPYLDSVPIHHITPFQAGGLTIVASKAYGASLVAANWSAMTHHGLVAETDSKDGTGVVNRDWEDYFAPKSQWTQDEANSNDTLAVQGTLCTLPLAAARGTPCNVPVSYNRTYLFTQDTIYVTVQLTATDDVSGIDRLWEVIPVATCTRLPCGGNNDQPIVNRKINGATLTQMSNAGNIFAVADNSGNRTVFTFLNSPGSPLPVKIEQNGLRFRQDADEQQIGWLKAPFLNAMKKGDMQTLNYRISFQSAPPAPQSLTAVPDHSAQILVTWANYGKTTPEYNLTYAAGNNAPDCSQQTNSIVVGTATSYEITGLRPNTLYTIAVCAFDAHYYSVPISVQTTTLPPPPSPQSLTAVADNTATKVTASWKNSGGTTEGFSLAYAVGTTAPACLQPSAINVASTAYQLTGLTSGTTYSITVCAYDKHFFSTPVSTQITMPPPAPSILTAAAKNPAQINLTWKNNAGTTAGFNVAYAAGSTPPTCSQASNNLSVGLATSADIKGLTPGTLYTLVICAYDAHYYSVPATTQVTTLPRPPAPTNLSATATSSGNSINVRWTNAGLTTAGFNVAYAAGTIAPNCMQATQNSYVGLASSTVLTGLNPGTQYAITVCSYNLWYFSNPPASISLQTPAN